MKHILKGISILLLAAVLAGCAAQPTAAPAQPTVAPVQPTQAPAATEAAPQPTQEPVDTQPPAATQAASVTRPFVMIASDSPSSPDPAENWAFGGAAYLPHVYDTLFRFAGESAPKLEADLAAEIPSVDNGGISQDGLTYTIKLQPGAKFHDGTALNADAVLYSYERIKALKLGANGITADWMKEMKKVDDTTVQFVLTQPFSDFLNSMGSVWGNYIVNPTLCKANEKDSDWCHAWLLEGNDAGSGPYRLAQFDKANNQVTLERFAEYWGGWKNDNPIEKAIIRWLPEASGARPLLEKGDVDIVVNLPATDFAALQNAPGLASNKYPSIMQYYLAFNGSSEALKDVRVRQALQYTFNSDSVINDIFNGNLIKMQAAVGPGYPDVLPAKTQYSYDLEKAKALLNDAGVDKLQLSANVIGAMPNDTAVLELWQADLAQIGVDLKINQVDYGVWSQAWFTDCTAATAPNIGQISALGVGGDYPSAWEVLAQVYPTPRLGGAKCSAVYLDDPELNDTFTKITNTTDAAARKDLFQKLYDRIADQAGAIWLGQGVDLVTLRDSVKGYSYFFSRGGNYVPLAQMSLVK